MQPWEALMWLHKKLYYILKTKNIWIVYLANFSLFYFILLIVKKKITQFVNVAASNYAFNFIQHSFWRSGAIQCHRAAQNPSKPLKRLHFVQMWIWSGVSVWSDVIKRLLSSSNRVFSSQRRIVTVAPAGLPLGRMVYR